MEGKVDYGEYMDKNNVRRQATTIIAGKQCGRWLSCLLTGKLGVLSAALAGAVSAAGASPEDLCDFILLFAKAVYIYLFFSESSLYSHA